MTQYFAWADPTSWWWEWAIALLIFGAFLLFRQVFTRWMFKFLLRFAKHSRFVHDLLSSFEKPLKVFFIFLGLFIALNYLSVMAPYRPILGQLFRSVIFILIGWGFYHLAGPTSALLSRLGSRLELNLDKIVLPFLSRVVQAIIILLVLIIVLEEWNYEVSGFIAGLGLGGLAFSLAAQDTLKNFLGGLVIITEKPFSLGDWIETPKVEGVVEDISFRSTQVRTFAQGLVTVPNSVLANEAITNWTRMGRRRVTFHLKVTYATPRENLKRCVDRIRHLLQNHPQICQEPLHVYFDRIGESSLDIFVYFFTKTTHWGEWLRIKEEINYKIMEILEEEKVELA
jgi:MscS family membrane protein